MQQQQHRPVFLATTALEAFWDTSGPVVFLGPWCCLYRRKEAWQALDATMLPGPFDGDSMALSGHIAVGAMYEAVLPVLAARMNALHGTGHDLRYWRIMLGPWLHVYLSVLHDRHAHIARALACHPDLRTVVLAEESYVVAESTHDFIERLHLDSFNLQFYSRILVVLGHRFPARALDEAPPRPVTVEPGWKKRAVRRGTTLWARVAATASRSVLLKDSYFSKSVELGLIKGSGGRISPIWGPTARLSNCEPDSALRDRLHGLELGSDALSHCVAAMLPNDIPTCFVEGYDALCRAAHSEFPLTPAVIFSANAWYYDEVFKAWAAGCQERGSKLLGSQHGDNYGALRCMPSEDHEMAIVDDYYTWGWERTGTAARVKPMPAPKLAGRERRQADNRKEGVLWVSTMLPRYLVQFPWLPADFTVYLSWQARFAAALSQPVSAATRLRPHREDNGWDLANRLRDQVPELRIESWNIPFQDSVRGCRLYVCDHLSTTFLEALASNTPTLLFWDSRANVIRPEAREYYDLLRAHGILFDTPEAAAEAVNAIYSDVEAWWNEPARQRAVARFCHRFARTVPDALALWSEELRLAALPRSQAESRKLA
jgi:putative transferase (TIGR04331 family)